MTDLKVQPDKRLYKLRKLQLQEIELIRKFIEICEKEHLMYFILGGTLLGAVRHKGFIPWDDDADFGMPRPDYEKFLLAASNYLPDNMMLQNGFSDESYLHYFSRIAFTDERIFVGHGLHGCYENVWIDIFPFDGMPNSKPLRWIHKFGILIKRTNYQLARFSELVDFQKTNRKWYEHFLIFCGKHLPVEKWFSKEKTWIKLDQGLKKCLYERTDYLDNAMGGFKLKEIFPKSVFGKGAWYEFEGMRLRGPENYDCYLTQLYGDYMTPPPESERNRHSTEIVEESEESRETDP